MSDSGVGIHYVRVGDTPLELVLDGADRAYVAEAASGSVALRRATSRSFARLVLAHELGVRAETVEIARDKMGRPHLRHRNDFDFSVSNTKKLVAVAVTEHGRIGLDLECEGRSAPGLGSRARRLRCWTLREAFLKELGLGLMVPSSALEVSIRVRVPSKSVKACRFGVRGPHSPALHPAAPREFACLRHAGHLWAVVRRGRPVGGCVSVHRWLAGAPRQELTEPLSACVQSAVESDVSGFEAD